MTKDLKTTSKFLSLILRHDPSKIDLTLDPQGWVRVEDLLVKIPKKFGLTAERLKELVAMNDKQRFAFSEDGQRIRASQGHSAQVDLALPPIEPPEMLFHGTATRFLDSILAEGLKPGSRQHVHLSLDEETARKVGQRHGKPVILTLPALDLHRGGRQFYCSENGVWLTHHVPAGFLKVMER